MKTTSLSILFVVVVTTIWSAAAPVFAISFTPYPCNTASFTEYAWPFSSSGIDDGFEINEPLKQQSGSTNYANNVNSRRYLYANRYVRYLDFYYTEFRTFASDRLYLNQSTALSHYYSADTSTDFWSDLTPHLTDVLQYKPLHMRFITDSANTKAGYVFSKIRVKCQSSPGGALPLNFSAPTGDRNSGILLAQDDVVNFVLSPPPSSHSLNIALWGPVATNRDVDLYVRCGATPTPTSYTLASTTVGSMYEYLRVTTTNCSAPYNVYVTVHNRGTVHSPFDIIFSLAKNTWYRQMYVGVENASAGDLTNVRNTMRNVAKQFYGLTEGQMLLNDVAVQSYPSGTVPYYNGSNWSAVYSACQTACSPNTCGICFYRAAGSAGFATSGVAVIEANVWNDPDLIVHELHHSVLNINWDEWDWDPGDMCPTCGHSISSNSWARSNNLCMGPTSGFTNHPLDPGYEPDLTTLCAADTNVSGWAGETVGLYDPPGVSPDIYNFVTHTFNGAINVH